MGYEIQFHYYARKEEGSGYDTENEQVFTKNLGKGTEEVVLDKLAGVIMGQLARRDIWVTDVEVYETVRRKISFKETKGGILLKNKKYSLDQGVATLIDEMEEEVRPIVFRPPVQAEPEPGYEDSMPSLRRESDMPSLRRDDDDEGDMPTLRRDDVDEDELMKEYGNSPLIREQHSYDVPEPPRLKPAKKPVPPDPSINKIPLRWEVFSPDPSYIPVLKQKNVPMTVGQKYPIMHEKVITQNVGGQAAYEAQSIIYTVVADNGKPFTIHSCHFLPVTKGLYGIDYGTDDVVRDDRPRESARLMFMDSNMGGAGGMPVIRR